MSPSAFTTAASASGAPIVHHDVRREGYLHLR
jgi:hypothetical protein